MYFVGNIDQHISRIPDLLGRYCERREKVENINETKFSSEPGGSLRANFRSPRFVTKGYFCEILIKLPLSCKIDVISILKTLLCKFFMHKGCFDSTLWTFKTLREQNSSTKSFLFLIKWLNF